MSDTAPPIRHTKNAVRGQLAEGIDCYVLGPEIDDHRVSKRAVVAALTGRGANHGKSERYIERIPAQILAEMGLGTLGPNLAIVEATTDGHTAHTYSATDFVTIMTAYTKWLAAGTMRADQEHLGRNAAAVLATFAVAGVVVAVRRACGLPIDQGSALDPDIRNALVSVPLLAASVTNLSTTMTVVQQNLATLVGRIEAVERRPAGLDEASLKTFTREIKDSNDDLKAHLSKELERSAKQTVWVRPTKKGAGDPMAIGLHILDTKKRFELHPFSGSDFARACNNQMHAETVHMVLTSLASHEHRRLDIIDHGLKVGGHWVRTPTYQRVAKSEAERRKLPGQYSFDEQVEKVRQAKADERKKAEPN